MKDDMTLYEVLEVSASASPDDIFAAFRQIRSIYAGDSLSTYSLFTQEERDAILGQAQHAVSVLGDTQKRAAYDRELVARGQLEEAQRFANLMSAPCPVFRTGNPGESHRVVARIREKAGQPHVRDIRDRLMDRGQISGPVLKSLRQAAGITLSDIFEASRVSVSVLEAIEEGDREKLPAIIYLKGFLKSYAECLDLDPGVVIAGYLDSLPQG